MNLSCTNKVLVQSVPVESVKVLNDLPPEIISWIVEKTSMEDRLHFQRAFANFPVQAVANIQEGYLANFAKQRGLYLLMDLEKYEAKYQYNYFLENIIPNVLLPSLVDLPLHGEACNQLISLKELMSGRISFSRLRKTFPNLQTLKIVIRDLSTDLLTRLLKTIFALSPQLTSLQVFVFSDFIYGSTWTTTHLRRLFAHLNDCHFDRLRHFTLLFEDLEAIFYSPFDFKLLNLLAKVEECYLRLPSAIIVHQLGLLEANQKLKKLGLIANCTEQSPVYDRTPEFLIDAIKPALASKVVHLQFRRVLIYGASRGWTRAVTRNLWPNMLPQIEKFNSLIVFSCQLNTEAYVTMIKALKGLSSLKSLRINLHYVPVTVATFDRLLFFASLPSVTHLTLKVKSITDLPEEERNNKLEFSHQIFVHLNIVQQFANLRKLEVVFPRPYSCSLCEITPNDDSSECIMEALKPFQTLTYLNQFLLNGNKKLAHINLLKNIFKDLNFN